MACKGFTFANDVTWYGRKDTTDLVLNSISAIYWLMTLPKYLSNSQCSATMQKMILAELSVCVEILYKVSRIVPEKPGAFVVTVIKHHGTLLFSQNL